MNNFVWADLSTYDPAGSKRFYQHVFDWEFHDADGYFVALRDAAETGGLYETPDFFKKIKMPHFWMSYIAVDDASATAQTAANFEHAKVELTDEFYGGKIALIRDPQGAGFTVYDGGQLDARKLMPGHMIWNELHVSDVRRVIPFYEQVFGWTITESDSVGKYRVIANHGEHICDLLQLPNEQKGRYEYWVCTFAVSDLGRTVGKIKAQGGQVVMDEGERIMVHDDSGEAFFYIQSVS